MRICGACRLCCKLFPLPVLEKPPDEWCEYLCDSGCSLHDHGQPDVCREYTCVWLDHEELPDEVRPDRIGVVMSECGTITLGEEEVPVFLFHPEWPGACQGSLVQVLIREVTATGAVAIVVEGESMAPVYDRKRYPTTSPREIEVAFRFGRSQDAEELKRLGAVEEDFRPLSREEAEKLTGEE